MAFCDLDITTADFEGKRPSTTGEQLVSVPLTNAQIISLPTSSIEVVPAPGLGFRNIFRRAEIVINSTAGAYSGITDGGYWWFDVVEPWGSNYLGDDAGNGFAYLTTLIGGGVIAQATFVPATGAIEPDPVSGWGNLAISAHITTASDNANIRLRASNSGNYGGGHVNNTGRVLVWYSVIPVTASLP